MKQDQISIQKKLSLLIGLTGLIVVIMNTIDFLSHGDALGSFILDPSIMPIFIFSLIFFLISNLKSELVSILHISLIYIIAMLAILDDYEAFNGYGFIIIFLLMLYKYGMLKRLVITKLAIIVISLIIFLKISSKSNTDIPIGQSLNFIIYFVFFFTVVYLIYSSERNRILTSEKRIKESLESKENELQRLLNDVIDHRSVIEIKEVRIEKLNKEIKILKEPWEPIDLSEYNITQREESIIKILCLNTGMANKEIAAELGISEGTIKQNMNKIFKKLGVVNRQKTIETCQRNFIENPLSKISKNL